MCKWRNGRYDLSRSSLWSILLVSFVTGPEKQRRQLRSVSFLFHLFLFVHWGVKSLSKLPFVASWLFFFFLSQLLWEDTKSVSSICDFSHIQNTHVELHTNRTGGRFEMIGPPRRRRSGRITFVSFRSFLALIFTNARLWFLPRPGPSWDTPGLSERSSWRCIWKLAGEIVTE